MFVLSTLLHAGLAHQRHRSPGWLSWRVQWLRGGGGFCHSRSLGEGSRLSHSGEGARLSPLGLRREGVRVTHPGSPGEGVRVNESRSLGEGMKVNDSGSRREGVRVSDSGPLGEGVRVSESRSLGEGVSSHDSGTPGDQPEFPKQLPEDYQEYFIPFNKQVLLQLLLKELSSTAEGESASLRTLSEEAEATTVRHYHSILEHLMALYEPINPDRDTLPSLTLGEPRQLEQEKVVLHSLSEVLDQANFNVLSDQAIQYALQHHDPLFKSQVNVQLEDYEYMKFWALGLRKGVTPLEMRQLTSTRNLFRRKVKLSQDRRYCKRVIVAARVRMGRMVLKSFKDIPLENLENLLPAVRMHISLTDRTFLYCTLLAGGAALFANMTVLGVYSLKVNFLLLLGLFGVVMVHRATRTFQHKRDRKALDHSTILYHKSTSNNGDLMVALVHRAQQEHVKEVLLAHAFEMLLSHHGHRPRTAQNGDAELAKLLSLRVSEWLRQQSGLPISFKGARALSHLRQLRRQLKRG